MARGPALCSYRRRRKCETEPYWIPTSLRGNQTRRALELADKAEDPQAASEYNQAAEVVASQLVAVEQELAVSRDHAPELQPG